MSMFTILRALGPIDARTVRRDSMLKWMIFLPLVVALILRLLLPWVTERILNSLGFDLTPYYPVLYGYMVFMTPVLFGVMIGFLLLDERDDDTLTALKVTPMTMNGYLTYRLGVPTILSIILFPPVMWLAGVTNIALGGLLLMAIMAAPLAPMYTLFLAAFAINKVQGFAMMKSTGIFLIAPLVAYFIVEPWQWLFGIFPTYWPVKLFWMLGAGESGILLVFIIGMVYQLLIVGILLRHFNQVMHRA